MSETKPKRLATIAEQPLGQEVLLYNMTGEVVHILNGPAYHIWQHCDGRHTPADIAAALHQIFDIPPDYDLDRDIQETLQTLARQELLQLG
ncbi:MAG: PqqD family protein [Anaerolineales bacterium]|nr:PqqD family protein [Anaerolineales bacterium]